MRRARPRRVTPARAEDDTRQRLIDVATRHFAERGFKHVTVRAICRDARANVAAINYHFGDKMGLYQEVILAATAIVRETTELAVKQGAGKAPIEQLRIYIRIHGERVLAKAGSSVLHSLVQREMQEPTEALGTLIDRLLRPRFEYLFRVVGAILDLPENDRRVALAATSVQSLIFTYRPSPITERVGKQLGLSFTPDEIIEHITRFATGALTAAGGRGLKAPLAKPI